AGNSAVSSLISTPSPVPSEARPMEPSLRAFMEARFGADFGAVRVHEGQRSSALARVRRAAAFTQGQNIVFGAGQYSPWARNGRALVAHELTHVLQQRGNGSASPHPAHEREAEAAA